MYPIDAIKVRQIGYNVPGYLGTDLGPDQNANSEPDDYRGLFGRYEERLPNRQD